MDIFGILDLDPDPNHWRGGDGGMGEYDIIFEIKYISVAEPEPVGAGTFWSEPEPV